MVSAKAQSTVAQGNNQQGQPLSDFLLTLSAMPHGSHAGPEVVVSITHMGIPKVGQRLDSDIA
jgi:hypothetical protein